MRNPMMVPFMFVVAAVYVTILGLGVAFLVWLIRDATQFDDADYEAVGMPRLLVVVVTLVANGLGLIAYVAWLRPRLVASQTTRLALVPTMDATAMEVAS